MAKKKQGLEKSGQRNASEPIRHVLWHKAIKVNRLPFEVRKTGFSSVTQQVYIALWQAGDICQTIGEFLVKYLTKRVAVGIQSFAKEIHI